MKGNINKLVLGVVIAAIPMFIAMTAASAQGKTIKGTYAFIGSGACLFAAGGFTDDTHFTPANTAGSTIGPNTWEGTYTFNKDGTGKMDALNRFVDTTPSAGLAHVSWEFTYAITGNNITFTYESGTYVATYQYGPLAGITLNNVTFAPDSWDGVISPDGKNVFVSFGVPMKLTPPMPGLEIVCNGVHQGFKTN